jgi:putative two-component system response regulator
MVSFPSLQHADAEYFGEPDRLDLLCAASHILVIDDEPLNVELMQTMLTRAGFVHVSGLTDARALELAIASRPPDLVILDVHMPGRDGFAVLEALAPFVRSDRLPVLVVTGDGSSDVRREALRRGARDFVTKPFDLIEVTLRVRNLLESRHLFQDLRKQNRTLIESVLGRTQELESTRVEMIERLAIAAEYRDENTNGHNGRVGALAGRLSRALGQPAEEAALIERAAALHDVGKIGIPDALLRKPGPLTALERRVMQTHTTIGARILGGSDVPLLRLAEVIALTHHERWDGTGYPHGLKGEEIPLPGRLVAIADVFDAITTDRPYRPGQPVPAALTAIAGERDRQLDGRLVDRLLSIEGLMAGGGVDLSLA